MTKLTIEMSVDLDVTPTEESQLKTIIDLLKKDGYLEYRDPECETFKEFLVCYDNVEATVEEKRKRFNSRNSGGTISLAQKLERSGILKSDTMAWHITYTFNFDSIHINEGV